MPPSATSNEPTRLRLAALAWIVGAVQFFVAHLVVERAWPRPYSWAHNTISDLGNVGCGAWGDGARYVCSPLHAWINTAIVAQGLLLLSGLLLAAPLWRRGCGAAIARGLLVCAALGWLAAGLIPADVDENLHVVLAVPTIFVGGNLGLVLTTWTLRSGVARVLRVLALLLGSCGLLAFGLFVSGNHLGLGLGGMERVTAYPMLVWLLAASAYLLRDAARLSGGMLAERGG